MYMYEKLGVRLCGRIYVDDVAVGTERNLYSGTQTYTENISVSAGQRIQVYCKLVGGTSPANVNNLLVTANNPYIAREESGY